MTILYGFPSPVSHATSWRNNTLLRDFIVTNAASNNRIFYNHSPFKHHIYRHPQFPTQGSHTSPITSRAVIS